DVLLRLAGGGGEPILPLPALGHVGTEHGRLNACSRQPVRVLETGRAPDATLVPRDVVEGPPTLPHDGAGWVDLERGNGQRTREFEGPGFGVLCAHALDDVPDLG